MCVSVRVSEASLNNYSEWCTPYVYLNCFALGGAVETLVVISHASNLRLQTLCSFSVFSRVFRISNLRLI